MGNPVSYGSDQNAFRCSAPRLNQLGFTAIETTIIMVAFVTLAAVFGFAVLKTGILTAEESRGAVLSALHETAGSVVLRGPVVGASNADRTAVDRIIFQVANVAGTGSGIDLSPDRTIITYLDAEQVVNLAPADWTVTWLNGFGSLLNPGEIVEFDIGTGALNPPLQASREFTIQVTFDRGPALKLTRTTPAELAEFVDIP